MRLAASLRYSLYAVTAVLFGSGAMWLATRYLEAWGASAQSWAALSMRVHGATAMAILALAGAAVALHVAAAWRKRENRVSGLALAAALLTLTATGYCLYYAGGESLRAFASLAHWILGLAVPLFFAVHAKLGKTAQKSGAKATRSRRHRATSLWHQTKNPENATAARGVRR
jgi:hypothetical protein